MAEGFLFSVAAGLILAEAYRSSRSESNRRQDVADRIEVLEERLESANSVIESLQDRVREVEGREAYEIARQAIHLCLHVLLLTNEV